MKTTNLKTRILTFFDSHQVPYQIISHETATSIEHVSELRKTPVEYSLKTLMFKAKDQYYLFCIRGHIKMDSKVIRKILKTHKLSFASKEKLFELSGAIPGTLPPIGQPVVKIPLYVDKSVYEYDKVAFTLGSLEESICLDLEDYLRIVDFIKEEFAQKKSVQTL